jgi:hypothetical protein
MDPLTFRIVIVGSVLMVLGLGADVVLSLTGHQDSAVTSIVLKVVVAGAGIVSLVLSGKAGVAPAPGVAPPKTLLALLSPRPAPRPPPPPPPASPPS